MLKEVNIEEHFVQQLFDITLLFLSIPIKPALSHIHKKFQNDKMLIERTRWRPKNIVNLIQICTEETHLKDFEGKIWTQTESTAIWKSISGILLDFLWNVMRMSLFKTQKRTKNFLYPYSGEKR